MNTIRSWECLSVAEFWRSSNWLGVPPKQEKSLAVDLQNEALENALENWQTLSTKEFFNLGNWEGHSNSIDYGDRQPRVFSMTLPVAEFFQCFGWYGNSTAYSKSEIKPASATIEDKTTTATTQQITIEHLSQLF